VGVEGLLNVSKKEFEDRLDWMNSNHISWIIIIIILTC
jgi:hypothetical protein